MTALAQATLRLHLSQLDSPDTATRLRAGVEICRLAGVSEAVMALSADAPPPSWPLVDIVPRAANTGQQVLVCAVRTSVGGGVVEEEVRVMVPMADGALMEAVERGKRGLARRMDAFVVGS